MFVVGGDAGVGVGGGTEGGATEESQVWDLNGCGLVGVKKRADLGGQGRKQRWRAGPQVWLSFGFFLRKLGVCGDTCAPRVSVLALFPRTVSTAVSSLPRRRDVLLLGLERARHVRGRHRSQRLGPKARASSAVIVGTPRGLWGRPLPGPLPAASPPCPGPAPQGH